MSQINNDVALLSAPQSSDAQQTFANDNSWMVQCLSLAALGMMTYLHLAPMIT